MQKGFLQEIKSVSFFHISAVLVHTGVFAYIDGTLLLILLKRYEVSTVGIHLDSVDNLSAKQKKQTLLRLPHHLRAWNRLVDRRYIDLKEEPKAMYKEFRLVKGSCYVGDQQS